MISQISWILHEYFLWQCNSCILIVSFYYRLFFRFAWRKASATNFTFLWLFIIAVSLNFRFFMFFFCMKIPARICYICRVSLQYIFFLQKTNLSIIQCCLGNTELLAFLAFIWFLSFSFFILQQQILQENTCPHFLHLYGFSSLWILLAENKLEYPLGTVQSLHFYGFSLVWISSIFFIILKILLSYNFIFKKIWSFSKLIHLCCPKQPQDSPHGLHSYGLSPLMILRNLFKISSKNVWKQLQFLKFLLCWLY